MNFEFEWDDGNMTKNIRKHHVPNEESESAFDDENKVVFPSKNSGNDSERLLCIGHSNKNQILTIVFTFRHGKIRIISARPSSKKERELYESYQY